MPIDTRIALLPIVILFLLGAGLIVAFIKSKTFGRWLIGSFVVILMLFIVSARVSYREAVEVSSSPSPTRDYSTDGVSGEIVEEPPNIVSPIPPFAFSS